MARHAREVIFVILDSQVEIKITFILYSRKLVRRAEPVCTKSWAERVGGESKRHWPTLSPTRVRKSLRALNDVHGSLPIQTNEATMLVSGILYCRG